MSIGLGRSLFCTRRFVLLLGVLFIGAGTSLAAGPKGIAKKGTVRSGPQAPAHAAKQRCLPCRGAAAPEPGMRRRQFAEIEVTLSDLLTLEDLRALPKAPGSMMKLLDSGTRVRAQLAAVTVGDLLEKGVSLTVRRDFMLVAKSGKAAVAESIAGGFGACSGPLVEGSNDIDYEIPEGDWTYSDIAVDQGPPNAQVTCIDVHYEIVHPRVSDLVVDLTDEDSLLERRLWDRQDGEGDNLSQTVSGVTAFEGQKVDQRWSLWVRDEEDGQTGYLDGWWIKVYYVACPEDSACSGPSAGASNSADQWIPYWDWTHSDIPISGVAAPV